MYDKALVIVSSVTLFLVFVHFARDILHIIVFLSFVLGFVVSYLFKFDTTKTCFVSYSQLVAVPFLLMVFVGMCLSVKSVVYGAASVVIAGAVLWSPFWVGFLLTDAVKNGRSGTLLFALCVICMAVLDALGMSHVDTAIRGSLWKNIPMLLLFSCRGVLWYLFFTLVCKKSHVLQVPFIFLTAGVLWLDREYGFMTSAGISLLGLCAAFYAAYGIDALHKTRLKGSQEKI